LSLPKNGSPQGIEENLKKAVAEMLVLTLLSREDMYAQQITRSLYESSGEKISMVSPYMLLYRLIENHYVQDLYKANAPDGRRRQYYQITEEGRRYLESLTLHYKSFTQGIALVLEGGDRKP